MSSDKCVIAFDSVTKTYNLDNMGLLASVTGRSSTGDELIALSDISFKVTEGDTLGIIGPNGAGKSTILKLLAGVSPCQSGHIEICGRIAPLIELGAGFHPELTGRENVYLNGALLGLKRKEIKAIFSEIVDFAELWDFIDVPVKKYSSGMFVRLGFSLAVHISPDILLVDEVLAVGDEKFQRKCLDKFREFRAQDKTSIIVSHDLALITNVCDHALFLNKGKIMAYGPVDSVVGQYINKIMGDVDGSAVLNSNALNLIFGNGKISLFGENREVTKRWGVYASMLVAKTSDLEHFWQDTTKAVWTCEFVGKNMLRCRGEFVTFPLVIDWDISLNENVVNLSVSLTVLEELHFERMEMNVMLNEHYTHWRSGDEAGEYPLDFTSRDYYNWDVLSCNEEMVLESSSKEEFPKIIFHTQTSDLIATVVNSSFFFGGRVLRYLDMNSRILKPGVYPYFEGEVEILK